MFELHPQLAKDCVVLGDLTLTSVLLSKDSNYPWLILVPRRPGVKEIHELSEVDQQHLLRESSGVSRLLAEHFKADKMNVAALGNMVPQLHLHHIVRFKDDAAWPKPIWGVVDAVPYDVESLQLLVDELRKMLSAFAFTPAS